MKTKHIFWGTLLVAFGVLLLLNNYTKLDFYWSDLWKFWPVVLILWGLAFFTQSKFIKSFLSALSGVVLAVVIFVSIEGFLHFSGNSFKWDHGVNIIIDGDVSTQHYTEKMNNDFEKATFNFEGGAGYFELKDTTSMLVDARTRGVKNNYVLSKYDSDNRTTVTLKMLKKRLSFNDGKIDNEANIKLNSKPVWNMNFDLGAASVDFDLSDYKTDNISVTAGAAKIKIKLGMKTDVTNLHVKSGASGIVVSVPENAGCEVNLNADLSSTHLSDFKKITKYIYRTPNFENSSKKIFIIFDSGVSTITVKRYSSDWY